MKCQKSIGPRLSSNYARRDVSNVKMIKAAISMLYKVYPLHLSLKWDIIGLNNSEKKPLLTLVMYESAIKAFENKW